MRKVFHNPLLKPSRSLYRALLMGFMMILVLGYIIFNEQEKYQNAIFDKEVSKIQSSIQERLNHFKMMSESLSNFVSFQDHVREDEWQAYTIKLLETEKRDEKGLNLSFVKFVHQSEIEQFKDILLSDWSIDKSATPSTLNLSPNKEHYCIIKYSTPQALRGLDLCNTPKINAILMDHQHDSINILESNSQMNSLNQGNLIYFVSKTNYFSPRIEPYKINLRGWTIVSLSLQQFFKGLASNDIILQVHLDAGNQKIIYASSSEPVDLSVKFDIPLLIGDSKVIARIIPNRSHDIFKTSRIIYVGLGLCVLLTILIGHLVWSVTLSRRRAQSLAENIQQDLYMARLRNRSIIENIPGVVYRMVQKDDEWIVEYMSDYIREVTGFPATKYIGKSRFFSLQFDPPEIDDLKNALSISSEIGSYNLEYQVRHVDGSIRWLSEQGQIVTQKNSQKFVAAIIFDITDSKEKNKRMQTLYAALHNAVEGISILTNEFHLIEVNQAFLNLFNLNDNAIIGTSLYDFLHAEDHELLKEEYNKKTNERFNFAVRVMIDAHHFLYVQLSFVPIFGASDQKTGYYCFAKDLSPLLERERALSEALSKIKSAYQAKSDFLANVSHELRTPLNAIIGYSELILEEEDLTTNTILKDVEKIKQAGSHLLKLINDILDASKLEAGKIEFYYECFEIYEFANSLVSLMMPTAQKQENKVILECDSTIGQMTSDYTRLHQCLLNLMSNACKFTHKGAITLSIKTNLIKNVPHIEFKVRDTGCGISPKALKKIFQPFTQGDSSTTRRYGGTGLGLSITKQFTELLGGCIEVESEYGHGSTFSIVIPQYQSAEIATANKKNHRISANLKNVI